MERVRDVSELPKAHLHLHFTGSMRPGTVLELADKHGVRLPDALTEAHCVRTAKGFWSADGEVKNTTAEKRDLEVRIHVGPATGEKARAHVKLVTDLKPGKSAEWSVLKVTADDPKGPCQIQVAVAQ